MVTDLYNFVMVQCGLIGLIDQCMKLNFFKFHFILKKS